MSSPTTPLAPRGNTVVGPTIRIQGTMTAAEEILLEGEVAGKLELDQRLTIAAKGNDDRPRLAPADGTGRTAILRLQGADLAAFLARQITKDEALARIEVRVF